MYLFYFAGAAVLAFFGLRDMKKVRQVTKPTEQPKPENNAPIMAITAPVATKKDDGAV